MKNNKKILAVALAGSLLLSNNVMAKSFKDVTKNGDYKWVYNSLDFLSDRGVFGGYPDGTFKPQKAVSFLEVLQIIKTVKNPSRAEIANARDSFIDEVRKYKVNDWAEDAVCYNLSINTITLETLKAASSRGFMKNSRMVYPDRNTVTVYFGRAFGFSNAGDESLLKHKDKNKINKLTKGYLANLIDAGIYANTGADGYFNGSKYISRSEVAIIAEKSIKYLENNSGPKTNDLLDIEKPIKEKPVVNVEDVTSAYGYVDKLTKDRTKLGTYKLTVDSKEYILDMKRIPVIMTSDMSMIDENGIDYIVGKKINFSTQNGVVTDIKVDNGETRAVPF